jgi:foldase protein PrsA
MPKTSRKTKKAVKVIKTMRVTPVTQVVTRKKGLKPIFFVKLLLVVAIGVVVFLLVQKNKSMFIVGTVNKSPITRWELNSKMAEKYGAQTFEEIVSERLLAENLAKNKIVVTDKEVQDELTKIKAQYGGEEQFKAAIAQFGMTEAKALASIKQSLGLKKLVESLNKIEITDAAVAKYYADNKATYAGKTLEEVSAEIKDSLLQQEIYTKSQEWYTQIRKDAKVVSFL